MRWMIAFLFVISACSAQEQDDAVSTPAEDVSTEDADFDAADAIGGRDDWSGMNPRWVLYDGDGEPVEALVEPFSHDSEQDIPIQSLDVFDCFVAVVVGDTYWSRAIYSLENGRMEDCYDFSYEAVRFVDEECTEPLTTNRHKIRVIDGALSIATEPYDTELRYSTTIDGDCVERIRSRRAWRYTPVPSEMLNKFNNPPYELRVEY